ncbi:peptide synthase [Gordonia pseudamarae]|uniref:Peptide synthase n=1 Tax=Gordonia pseudamarae TaxID=2831662 RepID=A0ABX6IFQ2_9ACTN|nr:MULTISPECIES: condensation domain-containing protein [Gordonia]MBD0021550.1 peptide synthase [Gordonia sp. (in: high G+C Gram-positive bacteria)]QHN25158.1 peptide synthase [Gordonia pseudamarae]QHN34090.1 peptide synthase [Gordonia pseudamarae]
MRITAMESFAPRPGQALSWLPTATSSAAAGQAPVYTGPLTFLVENHVRGCAAARTAGTPHHAYLGSGTEVDGDLDEQRMTRALDIFVRRHSALRTWFETDDRHVAAHLVDADDVSFAVHAVEEIDTDEQFQQHIAGRFSAEAISTSYPGFAFGALRRPGSFTLFFGCDHALSDGASQAFALTEIIDVYTELGGSRQGADTGPATDGAGTRDAGGYLDYAGAEAALAAHHLSGSDELDRLTKVFADNDRSLPTFPLDLGLAPGETAPVVPIEVTILTGEDIGRFESACRSAGSRLLTGIYAALAATDAELAGRTDYYGMTVFNTRSAAPRFASAQGWFAAFAPVTFPISGAATFTELLAAADTGYQAAKPLAGVPVQAAFGALIAAGATPASLASTPNLLSYIDFRRFPAAGNTGYEQGVIFTGEGRTANASLWINRDHRRLYLGSQTPGTPYAQHQVQRYFAHLCSVIQEVARSGDYTLTSPVAADVA